MFPSHDQGGEMLVREVMGILDIYKAYHKICKDIQVTYNKFHANKIDHEEYKHKTQQLEQMKADLMKTVEAQESELLKYKAINEKYHTQLTT